MYCSNCGIPLIPEAKFCNYCGKAILNDNNTFKSKSTELLEHYKNIFFETEKKVDKSFEIRAGFLNEYKAKGFVNEHNFKKTIKDHEGKENELRNAYNDFLNVCTDIINNEPNNEFAYLYRAFLFWYAIIRIHIPNETDLNKAMADIKKAVLFSRENINAECEKLAMKALYAMFQTIRRTRILRKQNIKDIYSNIINLDKIEEKLDKIEEELNVYI